MKFASMEPTRIFHRPYWCAPTDDLVSLADEVIE
jgi:hypothetical protein